MLRPDLPPAARILLSACIALATFLIVLDYSIANVSLPYIAGDLGVSDDQGTYVITSFAVGNAIGLPLTGWLTKRLSAVRLLLLSLLGFTFFSGVCGASWTFSMLITSRFLQGFVAGPLLPLSQTLMITVNPQEKQNSVMALWSTVAIVGPVAGPLLGGYISFDYSWPWIFYINLPVGILSSFVIWFYLRKTPASLEKPPLDVVGLVLVALSMGFLQVLLDKGEQFDWWRSLWICSFGAISLISFIFLLVWSAKTEKPLIELRLFKIRSYAISFPLIFVIYSIYMGSVVIVPLWLQEYMGYNSIMAGLAIWPIGLAPLLFGAIIAKLLTKLGIKLLLLVALLCFAFSCFYTSYFDTRVDLFHIELSRFLLGLGIVFFITPLFSLSVQDLPHEDLPSATGVFHLVRAMSGAIGTSVFTTLWMRRSYYHHQILSEATTPFSSELASYKQEAWRLLKLKADQALALLNETVDAQAAMLAINDCFYLMGFLFLALIPLCFLIRKKKLKSIPVIVD